MTEPAVRAGRGPKLAVAVAGIALMLAGILFWRARQVDPPPAEAHAVPVDAALARPRDVPITLDANGTVASLAVAQIKPQVDGRLVSVMFREGDIVRKGQVLATIDPRVYRAQVARAEAALRKDRALAADLRLNEGRARQLAALGAGPAQNADTLAAQASAASATADGDAADLAIARLNLEFTQLRAPIDGRAGLRQIDVGTIVRTSDATALVSITQMAPISVLFSVPQNQLDALRSAQKRGALPVMVVVEGAVVARGSLAAIDSTVDATNGQIRLRAIFPNSNGALWPGQLVPVRIALDTLRHATAIVDDAVLNGPSGPYAYVIDSQKKAQIRALAIGPSVGGYTVVTAGLRPGEQVVASGQLRLKPGSRVSVQRLRD